MTEIEKEKKGEKGGEDQEEIQRIRMTLRGREVKPLEYACDKIVSKSKMMGFKTRGPVRIPTKKL